MDNLNDIKKIWLSAGTDDLPDPEEMRRTILQFRNRRILQKGSLILVALFLTSLLILTGWEERSALLSTRIGVVLMLGACIILLSSYANSLRRALALKNCSNKAFLRHLEQAQQGRIRFYKKTQLLGMALVSAGLILYIFEWVLEEWVHGNKILGCLAYTLLAAWLGVSWFVIRPRAFKRNMKKIQEQLRKMEALSKQF